MMAHYGQIIIIKKTGADGSCFPLLTNSCRIGRGPVCDIRIQREAVSEEHCLIETRKDLQVWIHNLTDNITLINGASISKDWVALKHKDLIAISDRSFRWEYLPGSVFYSDVGAPCQQNSKIPHKDMKEKRASTMKKLSDKNIVSDNNCLKEKQLVTSSLTPLIASAAADVNLISRRSLRTSTSNQVLVLDKVSFVQEDHRDVEKLLNKKEKVRKSFRTPKKYDCLPSVDSLNENESCFGMEHGSPICSVVEKEELKIKENFLNESRSVNLETYLQETPRANTVTELSRRRSLRTPRMRVSLGVSPFRKDKSIISCENSLKSHDTTSVVKEDLIDFSDTNPEISSQVTSLTIAPNSVKKLKLRNTPRSQKNVGFHFSDDDTSRKENVETQSNIISSVIKTPITTKSDLLKMPMNVEFEKSSPHSKHDASETQSRASKQCRKSFRSLILTPLEKDEVFQITPNCVEKFTQRNTVDDGWSVREMYNSTSVKTSQIPCNSSVDLTEKNKILREYLDDSEINDSVMGNTSCSDSYIMHLKTPETPSFEYLDVSPSSDGMISGKTVDTPMSNRENQASPKDEFSAPTELMNTPHLSLQDIRWKKSNKLKGIKRKSLKAEENNSWDIGEIVIEKLNANDSSVKTPRKRRSEIKKQSLGISKSQKNTIETPNYADCIKDIMQTPNVIDDHFISQKCVRSQQKSRSRVEAVKDSLSLLKKKCEIDKESEPTLTFNSDAKKHVHELHQKTPGMKYLHFTGSSAKTRRSRRFDIGKYSFDTPILQNSLKNPQVETPNFSEAITEMMKTPSMTHIDHLETRKSGKFQRKSKFTVKAFKDSTSHLEATPEIDELPEIVQSMGSSTEDSEIGVGQEVNKPINGSIFEKSTLVESQKNYDKSPNFAESIKEMMQTPHVTLRDILKTQISVKSTSGSSRSIRESVKDSPAIPKQYSEVDESCDAVQHSTSITEENEMNANEDAPGLLEEQVIPSSINTPRKQSMWENSSLVTPGIKKTSKKMSGESPNFVESIKEMMQTPCVTLKDNLVLKKSIKSTRRSSRYTKEANANSPSLPKESSEVDELCADVQHSNCSTEESETDENEVSPRLLVERVRTSSVKTPRNKRSTLEKSPLVTPALQKSSKKISGLSPNFVENINEVMQTPCATMVDDSGQQKSVKSKYLSSSSKRKSIENSTPLTKKSTEVDESCDVPHSVCSTEESETDANEDAPGLLDEQVTTSNVKMPKKRAMLENSPLVKPALYRSPKEISGESPKFVESIKELMQTPCVTLKDNLVLKKSIKSTRRSSRYTRESNENSPSLPKESSEVDELCADVHHSICSTEDSETDEKEVSPGSLVERVTTSSVQTTRNKRSTLEKSSLVTPALHRSSKKISGESPNFVESIKEMMQTPHVTFRDKLVLKKSIKSTRRSSRHSREANENSHSLPKESSEVDELCADVHHSICSTEESETDGNEDSPGFLVERVRTSSVKTPRNMRSPLEKSPLVTPALQKSTKKISGLSPNFVENINEVMQTPCATFVGDLGQQESVKGKHKPSSSKRESIENSTPLTKESTEVDESCDDVRLSFFSIEESETDANEDAPRLLDEQVKTSNVKMPRKRCMLEDSPLVTPALHRSSKKISGESPNFVESIKEMMQTPHVTLTDNLVLKKSIKSTRRSSRYTRESNENSPSLPKETSEVDELCADVQHSFCSTEESETDGNEVSPGFLVERVRTSSVKTPRNKRTTLEKSPMVTPGLQKSSKKISGLSPNFVENINEVMQTPCATLVGDLGQQESVKGKHKPSSSKRKSIENSTPITKKSTEVHESCDDFHLPIYSTEESETDANEDSPGLLDEQVKTSIVKMPRKRYMSENSSMVTPALHRSSKKISGLSPNFVENIREVLQTPCATMVDDSGQQKSVKSNFLSSSSKRKSNDNSTPLAKESTEVDESCDDVRLSVCSTEESETDANEDAPRLLDEQVKTTNVKMPRKRCMIEDSPLVTPALHRSSKKISGESPNFVKSIKELMQTPCVTLKDNLVLKKSVKSTRRSSRYTRESNENSPSLPKESSEVDELCADVQHSFCSTEESETDGNEVSPRFLVERVSTSSVKTPRNKRSTLEKSPLVTPALQKDSKEISGLSPNFVENIREVLQTPCATMVDDSGHQKSVKSKYLSSSSKRKSNDNSTPLTKESTEVDESCDDVRLSVCSTEESETDANEDAPGLLDEQVTTSNVKMAKKRAMLENSPLVKPALYWSPKEISGESPKFVESIKELMQTPCVTLKDNLVLKKSIKSTRRSSRYTRESNENSPSLPKESSEVDELCANVQNSICSTEESETDGNEVSPGFLVERVRTSSVKTPMNKRTTLEKSPLVTPALQKSSKKISGLSSSFVENINEVMQTPCATFVGDLGQQESVNGKHKPSSSKRKRIENSTPLTESTEVDESCDVPLSICSTEESETDGNEVSPGFLVERVGTSSVKTPRNKRSTLEKSPLVTPALQKDSKEISGLSPNFVENIREVLQTPCATMVDSGQQKSVKSKYMSSRSKRKSIENSTLLTKESTEVDESCDDFHLSIYSIEEGETDANEDAPRLLDEQVKTSNVKMPRRGIKLEKSLATPRLQNSLKKNSGESPNFAESMMEMIWTPCVTLVDILEQQTSVKSARRSSNIKRESFKVSPTLVKDSSEVDESCDDIQEVMQTPCVSLIGNLELQKSIKSVHRSINTKRYAINGSPAFPKESSKLDESCDYVQDSVVSTEESETDANEVDPGLLDVQVRTSSVKTPRNKRSTLEKLPIVTPALQKSSKKISGLSTNFIESIKEMMQTPRATLVDDLGRQKSVKSKHGSSRSKRGTIDNSPALTSVSSEVDDLCADVHHSICSTEENETSANEDAQGFMDEINLESLSCVEDIKIMIQEPHAAALNSEHESHRSPANLMGHSSSRNEDCGIGENQKTQLMQEVHLITPGVKNSVLNLPASLKSANVMEEIKEMIDMPCVTLVDFMKSRESENSQHSLRSKTEVENSQSVLEVETSEFVQSSGIKISETVNYEEIPKTSTSNIQCIPNTSGCSYKYISRVKELMSSRSPISRYSNFKGVKRMFTAKSPNCSYLDVSGLKDIFNLSGSPLCKDSFIHEQQSNVDCSVQTSENISVDELLIDKVSQPHVVLSRISPDATEQISIQNKKVMPTKGRYSRRVKNSALKEADVIANGPHKNDNFHSQSKSKGNNKSRTKKALIQNEKEEMSKPKSVRATRRNKDLDITQSVNSQQPQVQKNEEDHSESVKSNASKRVKFVPEVKENSELISGDNARTKIDSTNMSFPSKHVEISADIGNRQKSNVSSGVKSRRAMLKLSVQFKSPATDGAEEEKAEQTSSVLGTCSHHKVLTRDVNVMASKGRKESSDDKKSNQSSAESCSISSNAVADIKFNSRRKTRSNKMVDFEIQSDEKVVDEEKQNVSLPTRRAFGRKTVSGIELEENDSNRKTTRRRNKIVDDKKSEESNMEDNSINLIVVSDMKSNLRRNTRANKMADSKTPTIEKIAVEKNQVVPVAPRSMPQKKSSYSEIEETVSSKITTKRKNKSDDNNYSTNFNSEDCFKNQDIIDNLRSILRRKTRSNHDELTATIVKTVVFEKSQPKHDEHYAEDDSLPSSTMTDVKPNLRRKTRTNKMINVDSCTNESLMTNEESQDNSVITKSSPRKKTLSSKDTKPSAKPTENFVNERKTRRAKLENPSDDPANSAARQSDQKIKEQGKGKKPAESKVMAVEEIVAEKSAVVTEKRSRRKNISVGDVADEDLSSRKRKISNSVLDNVDQRLNGTDILNDDTSLRNDSKHKDKSHVKKSKVKRTELKGNEEIQDSSNLETRTLRNKTVANDNSETIKPRRVMKRKISDDGNQDDSQNSHKKQNVHVEERFNLRRKIQKTADENVNVAGKSINEMQEKRPALRQRKSAR